MILIRGKCKECNDEAEKWIYGKRSNLCTYHYKLHKLKIKKPKQLKKVSPRQSKRLSEYKKAKEEYLFVNKICQVETCQNLAAEIHHKAGRIGALLWNKYYFLAVCRECHNKIELSPLWAKANGYSVSRLTA